MLFVHGFSETYVVGLDPGMLNGSLGGSKPDASAQIALASPTLAPLLGDSLVLPVSMSDDSDDEQQHDAWVLAPGRP